MAAAGAASAGNPRGRVASLAEQLAQQVTPSVQFLGRPPVTEKFYDVVGRLTPFPNFVVTCECGQHTKYCKNAFLAA